MRPTATSGISVIVLAAALLFAVVLARVALSYDFRAFYCAGSIAYQHGNPYNDEPLHSCEKTLRARDLGSFSKTTTLPAPLPGYAIAMFVPLSLLPFEIAAHLWTFILYAAIGVAVLCAARLTGVGLATAAAAFLLSLCAASVGLGETVPICVAAICITALLAEKGNWIGASIAAAVSLVEPHIGLPIVVALAVWAPLSRIPLMLCLAALAVISIGALGLAANIEYFTQVLPDHALSEIGSDAQMSLSVILHGAGMDPHLAIAFGLASYFAAAACGVLIGGVLARRFGSNAFLVLTPGAMSLIGGTFIHVTQMAAAIPLAMMLMANAPRYRTVFLVAMLLLAIPWRIVGSPMLIATAMIVVFFLAWENSNRHLGFALSTSAAALLILLGVNLWMAPAPSNRDVSRVTTVFINPRYAEASWARYNDRYLSSGAPETWWRRVPTWTGLLLLAAGAGALASIQPARRPLAVTAAEQ